VLAHALMARRTEFYRNHGSSFASFLVDRGWRVVVFDFRGHGESGPAPHEGGTYGYDDFVARDLAAVCAFAREQTGPAEPLVVAGHSLGGHAAFVAQGTGAIAVDALVGIAAAPPFLRQHEPSRRLGVWGASRPAPCVSAATTRRLPAAKTSTASLAPAAGRAATAAPTTSTRSGACASRLFRS